MDPSYGQRYRDLYRRHWWWRARETAILRELRRLRPDSGWRRLLDVGCGDGLLFDRLAEFGEVEGVEPDLRLLDPKGPWRRSIHAVPFDESFRPTHRYDVILMLDVLEHLADATAALRHARSLLAPGGIMVITVPAFQWLWTRHDEFNHHVQRFDRSGFRILAGAGGLRILRERFLFQWLVPAKLLVRAVEKIRSNASAPASVPPGPVNWLLSLATRAELAISDVVPMPFGSSLMVSAVAADGHPRG